MKYIILNFLLIISLPQNMYSEGFIDSLVAYWSFDDSTAKDFSGNNYHGTLMNQPKPIKGVYGTAFSFVGKNNYILDTEDISGIGDHILLPMIDFKSLGDFTITMWVKEYDMSWDAGEAFIWFGNYPGYLGILHGSDETDKLMYIRYAVGCNDLHNEPVKVKYEENQLKDWVFLTIVFDSGIMKAFFNGQLKGTIYQEVDIKTNKAALARHWWDYPGGMRTSARFTGAIDEVMIFKKALKEEEIIELHENPGLNDTINITALGDIMICEGDSVLLQANKGLKGYEWYEELMSAPFAKDVQQVWVKTSGNFYCRARNKKDNEIISNFINVVVGNLNSFELTGESLHYDSTFINTNKCLTITVKNRSSISKTLNSIRFKNAVNYYVPSGELPALIGAGATKQIKVCFKPSKAGFLGDSLIIEDECFPHRAYLTGIGATIIDKIVVTASNTVICPGDSVMLQGPAGYEFYEWYDADGGDLIAKGERTIYVKKAGKYTLKINVPPDKILHSENIEVSFIEDNPFIVDMPEPHKLVFDTTNYGSSNCMYASIKNKTNKPQTLSETYSYINSAFSVPQSQFPIHFAANETKQIKVCYMTTNLGDQYDTLIIGHVCLPLRLPLEANCLPNKWNPNSKCDMPLEFVTKSVTGKFVLKLSEAYPNPVAGIVKIDYNSASPENTESLITCTVYDSFGNCVAVGNAKSEQSYTNNQSRYESGTIEIDCSLLPRGVYIAFVQSASGREVRRIVKNY